MNTLFARYIPTGNMDFFAKDIQALANFAKTYLGSWDSIMINAILESPFLNIVRQLHGYMEHIETNVQYIIFSQIWRTKFTESQERFESNLGKFFFLLLLFSKQIVFFPLSSMTQQ